MEEAACQPTASAAKMDESAPAVSDRNVPLTTDLSTTTASNEAVPLTGPPQLQDKSSSNTLSKNQLRKIKRWEKKLEIKQRRKQQERETKAAKALAQGRDIDEERRLHAINFGKSKTRQIRLDRWATEMLPRVEASFQVCIDGSFEASMATKEVNSLSSQIRYCYASNRRSEHPCRLTYTSAGGDTLQLLQNVNGFEEWKARCFDYSSLSLEEYFQDKLAKVVYLTSDSELTLTELENDKIYVIGGIVDRNRLKGVALDRATALGVATAKLPIDQYLKQMPSTRVLTCNHVYALLLKYKENGGDWKKAFMDVLPQRKEAQFVTEAESTEVDVAKEDA
jgi:tRNA (guanine9-N1)-methyltransferase